MYNQIRITVPEYYKKYIDKNVNLTDTPKVCCPFHKEDTPSFSYNPVTGRWRCFGACKVGGDVIALHQKNYKLSSRKEAESSLKSLLGIQPTVPKTLSDLNEPVVLNEDDIELDKIYNLCLLHANSVDRWIDMDYIMSISPVDIYRLKDLLKKWGVKYD